MGERELGTQKCQRERTSAKKQRAREREQKVANLRPQKSAKAPDSKVSVPGAGKS